MWLCLWLVGAMADTPKKLVKTLAPEVAAEVAKVTDSPFKTLPKIVVTTFEDEVEILKEEWGLTQEQVAEVALGTYGLYTPEDDVVRLFWDQMPARAMYDAHPEFQRQILRCALAHELTHALQHRVLKDAGEGTVEGKILREGHAQWAMREVCEDAPDAVVALDTPEAVLRFGANTWTWKHYVHGRRIIEAAVADKGPRHAFVVMAGRAEVPEPVEEVGPHTVARMWPIVPQQAAACAALGEEVTEGSFLPGAGAVPPLEPTDFRNTPAFMGTAAWKCGEWQFAVISHPEPKPPASWGEAAEKDRFKDVRLVAPSADGEPIGAIWEGNALVRVQGPGTYEDAAPAVKALFEGKTEATDTKQDMVLYIASGFDIPAGTPVSEDRLVAIQTPILAFPFRPALAPHLVVGQTFDYPILMNEFLDAAPAALETAPDATPPGWLGLSMAALRQCVGQECAFAWATARPMEAGHVVRHGDVELVLYPADLIWKSILGPGDNPIGKPLAVKTPAGRLLDARRFGTPEPTPEPKPERPMPKVYRGR